MSRIFQHTNQSQVTTSPLQGAAFGGGGGGRTRGKNGSPNVYSNNHSNATRTYGWRSDRSRLDGDYSDPCVDSAAKSGITAGILSKNPGFGLATAAVDYAVCKAMDK